MDPYASIISAKIQKSFPGLRSRDNLKAFKSAKHHRKLHSKWSQVNCVRGLIKEGNEKKKLDGVQTCDDTNGNNKRREDLDLAKITRIEMFFPVVCPL